MMTGMIDEKDPLVVGDERVFFICLIPYRME